MRGIVTLKTATPALWFTASEALNFYLEGLFSVDTQGTPLPDRNGVRIELDWNDVQRVEIALRDAGLLGKISFEVHVIAGKDDRHEQEAQKQTFRTGYPDREPKDREPPSVSHAQQDQFKPRKHDKKFDGA